jgi:hypothetical protein
MSRRGIMGCETSILSRTSLLSSSMPLAARLSAIYR